MLINGGNNLSKQNEIKDNIKNIGICNILNTIQAEYSMSMLTLLIVEDDATSLLLLQTLLKDYTKTIYTAQNGAEALEIVNFIGSKIDIVISDINMPIVNGLKLASDVIAKHPNMPIVLLTGDSDSDLIIEAINIGVSRFLKKPINAKKLLSVLDEIARNKFNKQKQEAIQSRLSFLWEIVNSFTLISLTDKTGKIAYANEAFCELYGFCEKEILGKTHRIIRHPDAPLSRFIAIWQSLNAGIPWRGIFKNRNKYGKDFHLDTIIQPIFTYNGEVEGYISLSHDITARVQSEERALLEISRSTAILNATPGIVFLTDGVNILHANNAFFELFSKTTSKTKDLPMQNVVCKTLTLGTQNECMGESWLENIIKNLGEIHTITINKDYEEAVYYTVAEEVEGGEEFVVIMQDITELEQLRHNLEKRVQDEISSREQKEELLAQSTRLALMGEMIAMIAHQWRQPLSYITANVGEIQMDLALNGDVSTEKLSTNLKDIDATAQHLSKTIDDFRDFFKPGKQAQNTNVPLVLRQSVSMLGNIIKSKDITINYEFDKEEIEISTYPRELLQVFLNLIKNSIDALSQKNIQSPKIILICCEGKQNIYISIKDNGGGIDEEIIDRIFDPYFSTKGNVGTGLGLYMSRTIISEHCRGSIIAANEDDGAVFKIILPKYIKDM